MGARRYTEEEFRAAVADPGVRTLADLCRALGVVPRGANYATLRQYAGSLQLNLEHELAWRRLGVPDEQLRATASACATATEALRALDVTPSGQTRRLLRERARVLGDASLRHLRASPEATHHGPVRRTYTDDELLAALSDPDVDDLPTLCARLGLRSHTGTHRRLRERARALGRPLPDAWSRPGSAALASGDAHPGFEVYPEAELRQALPDCLSAAATIRALGDAPTTTTYRRLRRSIAHYGIDTSHFRGNGARPARRRPLTQVLVRGRTANSTNLRRRLIEEGLLPARCDLCERSWWRDRPIPLELDHVDGDRTNNELANLRLLCPNCHALTPTYRGRNRGRYTHPGEDRRVPSAS